MIRLVVETRWRILIGLCALMGAMGCPGRSSTPKPAPGAWQTVFSTETHPEDAEMSFMDAEVTTDGNRVIALFLSGSEASRWGVRVMNLAGQKITQMEEKSKPSPLYFWLSPEGRYAVFVRPSEPSNQLVEWDLEKQTSRLLMRIVRPFLVRSW